MKHGLASFIFLFMVPLMHVCAMEVHTDLYTAPTFPALGYDLYKFGPDSSFQYFKAGAQYFLQRGDTVNYITCLMGFADIERRQGRYNNSFDILWNIQKHVIRSSDYNGQTDLEMKLGRLYGIYGQDSLALSHHKKALALTKQYPYYKSSGSSYFAIAEQLIKMQQFDEAILYCDSCYLAGKGKGRLIYVDALYGYAYLKKGDYRKTAIYFKGLIPIFASKELGYLAKVYAFNAELKLAVGEPDSALIYYKKALATVNELKQHYEIKPHVLENIAYLYKEDGHTDEAYRYMLMYKNISDSLFSLQSAQNKELFEIKNAYQEDISEQEALIFAQQKLLEITHKASVRLKLILGILLLLCIIALITFRQRFQVRRLVTEKKQNEDMMEVKNKELTANALQFIEKEHAFNELLDFVKEKAPEKFQSFHYKSKQSNKRIWEDFHLRFTQTNTQFYDKLRGLYPELTQTDLKHCALVKLNFDSKEMSLILGISVHGVHTARSRIRKKLGLKRDESLSGFIAGI